MKEIKSTKKPLIYYGLIVLAVLLLFNMLITPMIAQRQVVEDVKSRPTRTREYAMKKKMLKDRFGIDITEV